jgi:hypothetical protein
MKRSLLIMSLSVPLFAGQSVQVTALANRVIPHVKTSVYHTNGYSNTSCYGSGTWNGNFGTASANCSTVSAPPRDIPTSVSWTEVFNRVQVGNQIYVITCKAHWIGSNCGTLEPHYIFPAEIDGLTMRIIGRKGGNMGKEGRIKFKILDIRAAQ